MKTNEIIKQLESLKLNQEDFIAHDDTGIFKKDVKALDEAIKIIKNQDNLIEYLNDRINLLSSLLDYSIRDDRDNSVINEYSMRKLEIENVKKEVLKDA